MEIGTILKGGGITQRLAQYRKGAILCRDWHNIERGLCDMEIDKI